MATLGYIVLLTTFVVASYAVGVSVAGARRGSRRLIESGIGAFHMVTALMVLASVLIVRAFVTDDFTIRYVSRYSDSVQPLFFKITSYWGGLDGSIMFWVFLLACFGSLAVHVNRDRHRELIPYVVAVIGGVQMFFLFLMLIHNNPFETYLTEIPPDGNGLNPLLQNIYMVIHPPSLYIGLVGMTIPFAFGMAALITGHLDDAWLRAVRRWTMFAWFFLTFGLTLGMIWAYEELGWGGFWGWDPVENAGALPWFTATAFFHSVMVQERRSMLRVWNVTLVILTFFLTIFGTFMTRSGIVQSVHSFGENPELAMMFSIFMAVILVFSFGLVIYRLPLLRASNELDSWASREAAFLLNNWILLFSAFFILFVTMFPTVSEAITGERITIGPPFFNRWMVPIGLILLLLTGIGPLLAWRKTTVSSLKYQFMWPAVGALVSAALVLALGIRVWSSGICFVLAGFVFGTIWQEFWRGAVIRRRSTGTDLFTATIGLVGRSRRRYGGYIVHVGIVLMFLGFAGQGYKQSAMVLLKPGQQAALGEFTVRMDDLRVTQDAQKQMITGHFTLFRNGTEIAKMYPARWFFNKHEEPTTEVAIRRRISEDFYLNMPSYQVKEKTASLEMTINPLVNWIKVGFYHSLLDWHHPDYPIDECHPMRDNAELVAKNSERDLNKYVEYLWGQTRELLSEFGKVDILWYDFSVGASHRFPGKGKDEWKSEELIKMIRQLQPKIILNDRLQIDQDVKTPEQYQPREWVTVNGQKVVWEACQTFSGSWGYHRDESTWKSPEMLIKMLINSVSTGGNLLLNVVRQ